MKTKKRVQRGIMVAFFTLALLASLVAPIALTPASAEGVVNGNENSEVLYLHSTDGIDPLQLLEECVCTKWHELLPTYSNNYHLKEHEDTNKDGQLSPCDNIMLNRVINGLESIEECGWYHVDEVTVTIGVIPKEGNSVPMAIAELMYLEFMGDYQSIEQTIYDPECTYWHEIRLDFCNVYHLKTWDDSDITTLSINGEGDEKLSSCDFIELNRELNGSEECGWYHVIEVAIDIIVSPIDKTPPKTTKEYGEPYYTDGVGEWITADTSIYLNATDEDSGVDYTRYRVWYNGEWTDWLTYTGPFTMGEIGEGIDCLHKIEYYSVDIAGNEESWHEVMVEADAAEFEAYSALAVDPFALRSIHVVYTEEASQDLIYKMSPDFGKTWTSRTVLISGLAEASEPDIEISPNGDIHVVFIGYLPGQQQRISHIWYDFAANNYGYENATDPANWEDRVLVDDTGRDNVYPQIAIDSLNDVHCVWAGDSDGVESGGEQDIFYSVFDERTWSSRITLYTNATTTPGWPNPQIISNYTDDLHVVFLDSNENMMKYLTYYTVIEEVEDDDGSGGNPTGEWGSYHGGIWSPQVADNVGGSSASYGTVAGLAIEGNMLHITWQDVRDGDGEVYENTRDLTTRDAFGTEWQLTFEQYIDDDGTSVGETLMESGRFDNLHLFFRDSVGYDIWYMEYHSAWSTPVKVADSGAEHVHLWSELAVDNFDSPLLTYTKATNDYTEFDICYKKPYHNQVVRVDNTPPTTTKTVIDTTITLEAKDYCRCEKYAILVVGRELGAVLPAHPHFVSVTEMEGMLRQKCKETGGWNITRLVVGSTDPQADATIENLKKAFADVKKAADEGRCCHFFFYYCDHGGQQDPVPGSGRIEPAGSIDNKDEFLPLTDGKLYDDELADLINSICKCKNTVIVIHACRSGGFIPDIVAKNPGKPMVICTSCREDEKSYSVPCHWAVYNHFLTEELKTCVSVEKAHDNAVDKIKTSGQYPKSAAVHPQIYDSHTEKPKFLYCCGVRSYLIHYRISYEGEPGLEQVGELNQPVSFELTEPGEYIIEYWAVDSLDNEEEHHLQTHYVDTGPPENGEDYPRYEVGEQNPDGTYQVTITDVLFDAISGVKMVVAEVDDTVAFEADDINLPEYEFSFVANLVPGEHTLTIEAWDVAGNYLQKEVDVVVPEIIQAIINIDPNTLNLKSKGKWITCYIELPEDYVVEDIDVGTVELSYGGGGVSAAWGDVQDGVLMVKFDRAEVQSILSPGDEIELTVSGELNDGTPFEGTDTIRVTDKGKK